MYKEYELNRTTYKHIKRMSREELESFLRNMHAEAYNQGVHAMASAVSTKVETALRNTPGIGEKRFNDIITSINAELNKEDS